MAPSSPPASESTDHEVQALFEEARRRRRRRRALVAVPLIAAVLAAAGVMLLTDGGGTGSGGGRTVPGREGPEGTGGNRLPGDAGPTTSLALPKGYWFNQVTASGTRLLLTGTVASTSLSAQCVAAPVDPRTLAVGRVVQGSCADPTLFGKAVIPVVSYHRGSSDGTIAIATRHPSTGIVTTSPVVTTFIDTSDTRPVTAYGGGWLWIYDVHTAHGPEALQVSATSGEIVDTVPMPQLYRPVVAANDDGLWLGNSIESSDGSAASSSLWHVAPGATSAVADGPPGPQRVFWLVGSGDHLWAGIGLVYTDQTIWRFDGPAGQVGLETPEQGYDPTDVVGTSAQGLWTVVPYPPFGARLPPGQDTKQQVVRINPSTGREAVISRIPPESILDAEEGMLGGQATVVDGSYFVLQPPFRADGYLGYKYLVRVR